MAYVGSEGLIEHRMHIGEALDKLFEEFADDHRVTIYRDPSPLARGNGERNDGRESQVVFLSPGDMTMSPLNPLSQFRASDCKCVMCGKFK